MTPSSLRTLNKILQLMHTENPIGESKLFPGRPKLTPREMTQRHKFKKKMMAAATGAGGGGKHGGADSIADIVIGMVREGLNEGTLKVTTKDGLAAEKLKNQQENKLDDRRARIAIAMMLTGGTFEPPTGAFLLDDGNTIEGDVVELEPLDD